MAYHVQYKKNLIPRRGGTVALIAGVVKESMSGERRVAITPRIAEGLIKLGARVLVERGAGEAAGYPDSEYQSRGVTLCSRDEVFQQSALVAQVRTLGANPDTGRTDLERMRRGQVLLGLAEPLTAKNETAALAARGVTLLALELVPRITRAQSMDVLSSMASAAGYKAVLIAAGMLPKMLPMMTTAAGTIAPAKVLVLGAGVAGLQAIATARRLGAVVSGYDIRPAAKEQVESLGAKFVVLGDAAETAAAEDKGGYAKAMSEEFYRKQQELLSAVIREQDVVISTAAVPGKRAPILIPAGAARGMAPGSVIVDLAAERGGNCALTKPGETVVDNGVTIAGPLNVPSTVPFHASQMFATNVAALIKLLAPKGDLAIPWADEIVREAAVLRDGEVINARVAETMGVAVPEAAAAGAGGETKR
jgi:NAD(P) transhydrogenase subunit alpha